MENLIIAVLSVSIIVLMFGLVGGLISYVQPDDMEEDEDFATEEG